MSLTRNRVARRSTLVGALVTLILASSASLAFADTLTVTRTDDPSPSNCDQMNCSLREAVNAANNEGPGSNVTILLQAGQTYTLTQPAGSNKELGGALLILHGVKIQTQGTGGEATINGNGSVTHDRVFDVMGGSLETHNIDVVGGISSTNPGGGGIYVHNLGNVYMYDGEVNGNSVSGNAFGGGIYNESGHVLLQRMFIAGNQATSGYGGGVYTNSGGVTDIYDSKLSGNRAFYGAALGSWGGPVTPTAGSVTILRAQISFNQAGNKGGAIDLADGGVPYYVRNVTINNNTSQGGGGAVYVFDGTLLMNNDTLSLNGAPVAGGMQVGGDSYRTTSLSLHNTIIAQNTGSGSTEPDCDAASGFIHSQGYNIIGDITGCPTDLITNRGPGDQFGTSLSPIDAKLNTTGFNGGLYHLLLTMALDPGSPAIDAGDPATGGCEATDARGVLRSAGGRCDIGAYEVVKPAISTPLVAGIHPHKVRISVLIKPSAASATYYIQYGVTKHYGERTHTREVHGVGSQRVVVTLTGLHPGQTYHWRIVVRSRDGTVTSHDHKFTTPRQ